jgi:hypothetical protein
VLDHEHDRALEVGVAEHRLGDEQLADGRVCASHRLQHAASDGERAGHGRRSAGHVRQSGWQPLRVAHLADGTYDALVVDASTGDDGSIGVEITIVAGPAKGEVVSLRTSDLGGTEPLDLLGVPATLTVRDGAPSLRLEP